MIPPPPTGTYTQMKQEAHPLQARITARVGASSTTRENCYGRQLKQWREQEAGPSEEND